MDLFEPKPTQRPTLRPAAAQVLDALAAGVFRGFFCETLVTLEGVQKRDRIKVFGNTRVESRISATGTNTIQISVGVRQDRKALHPKFFKMIQGATRLGLRALRAPARIGWVRIVDQDGTFFAADEPMIEHLARMNKVNDMATAIARKGVGHVRAVALGREFADCDDANRPALWCEGLSSASGRKVKRAIAEWSDGDSIAAHYGYSNDLFCTEDRGKNASGPSVLDEANRQWLSDTFGIRFTTLGELAQLVGI